MRYGRVMCRFTNYHEFLYHLNLFFFCLRFRKFSARVLLIYELNFNVNSQLARRECQNLRIILLKAFL
jgi:hypothetical protein